MLNDVCALIIYRERTLVLNGVNFYLRNSLTMLLTVTPVQAIKRQSLEKVAFGSI